jgi:hypothetical protein
MERLKKQKGGKTPEQIKKTIINLFKANVKGKKVDSSASNVRHDGKDGHWLETQMGVKHNGDNAPDLDGFEMKNNTTNKTSFGDWSASYYIFKDERYFNLSKKTADRRDVFMQIFGAPNIEKDNRYSWSGKPIPKINKYNDFGQTLKVDRDNNINIIYSFSKDKRKDKNKIVPKDLQKENILIVQWAAEFIKKKVEDKFNKLGWFKCIKNSEGIYTNIVFGAPINFETWIEGVKKGLIFFDSGMYQSNSRNYSQWRADNKYWDSLVIETY